MSQLNKNLGAQAPRDKTLNNLEIKPLELPGHLAPRYGWWDPLNLFGAPPTTTTHFPYPEVAAFFSNPGAAVNRTLQGQDIRNITQNAEVVKCLGNLIKVYSDAMTRAGSALPNCIQGQVMGAVWLVPQLLGLLPTLSMFNVPSETMANCKYEGGCILLAIQKTITEASNQMGGFVNNLNAALPTVTNLGKGAIYCISNEFKNIMQDLPKTTNMTCLKQTN